MISCDPMMATGTMSTPESIARWKPPFLNGPSRPSRVRVPSGKMTTDWPDRIRRAASPTVRRADAAFWRSMKMKRPAAMAQPNSGILDSCFLAMKRNDAGMATNTTQMSTIEAWLGMKT